MKDIGLMHYFLGLEVWQEQGHIFLGQGRYTVDILSQFQMGDCRLMSTPMITNWKKLHASESKLMDPTLYRQLIGFFYVSGQYQARHMYCSELIESIYGGAQESALSSCEACASLLAGYRGLRFKIQAG